MSGLSFLPFSFSPSSIYEFVRDFFQGKENAQKKAVTGYPHHRLWLVLNAQFRLTAGNPPQALS
jgi:hypothetical protein